jgi:hypothetical protein
VQGFPFYFFSFWAEHKTTFAEPCTAMDCHLLSVQELDGGYLAFFTDLELVQTRLVES